MYTGCDLNTTTQDMEEMALQSPYVLAAIGNQRANPNDATAFGVLGAIQATLGNLEGKRLLVHGCGGVGSTVAAELVRLGAKVYTVDTVLERADVFGATNVSIGAPDEQPAWWTIPVDALVPCSKSGLVTRDIADQLNCSAVVGATNLPFVNHEVQQLAEQRGVRFVPEGISSAGAVILDSVEHFDNQAFTGSPPMDFYEFCRNTVKEKTAQLLDSAAEAKIPVSEATRELVMEEAPVPIGMSFRHWQAGRRSVLGSAVGRGARQYSTSRRPPMASQSPANQKPARAMNSSPAGESADVLICGAGIMGLSIAYQLKRRSPETSVMVLERFGGLGYGSSGYSTGFQRAYYSQDHTMQLALDGIHAYKNWGEYTGLGSQAEAYFTQTDALWMLGKPKQENQAMVARLAEFGVHAEVLGADDVQHRYPALSVEPYPELDMSTGELVDKDWGELSAVWEEGCGHLDSTACLRDMLQACTTAGVQVRFKSPVSSLSTTGGRAVGVELADGSKLSGGAVINCMGPWFGQLNGSAGVSTSTTMLPTRIQVGHKMLPDDEQLLGLPFVADAWGASGIYFMPRRANNQLVFGSVAHRFESEIVDPDDFNEALDPDVKQDYLSCLFHRLPTLATSGEIQGFSHMYTVNQDDVHPVIGQSEQLDNFWLCNGFSGHGFKLAPAVGSLVAQQLTNLKPESDTWETGIPHEFLSATREPLSLKVKTHFA